MLTGRNHRAGRLIHYSIAVLALSLLAGGAAYGKATDENGESYSFYMISCGSYIEHRTAQKSVDNDTADTFYVAGWISAYNRLTPHTRNITDDTDLDSVMLWLEKYCQDNPLSNLESGLYRLSAEQHPAAEPPPHPAAAELPPVTTPPANPPPKFRELPF